MRNRLALVAAAMSTVVVGLTPAVANASVATSCSFDAGTAAVTAVIGSGDNATLIRNGSAIEFGGAPCGAATVTNTDQINISAPDTSTDETLTISEAQGTFAPGKTAEADGSDEIEIVVDRSAEDILAFVGTSGTDSITVDPYGADLIAGAPFEDEVSLAPVAGLVTLDGGGGDDVLSLRAYEATVIGGPGDDQIAAGGSKASSYSGGTGVDSISFPWTSGVVVHATDPSYDYDADRGLGVTDTLTSIESVTGTDGPDGFVGSDANDHFIGGAGNDLFIPLGGDDTIEGDDGVDQYSPGAGGAPLQIDLTAGTATGDGDDTFTGVEVLAGSVLADRFTGDPRTSGVIFIQGYGGRDVLDLREATHRQFVWTTPSDVYTPPSWSRLVVEDIRRIKGSDGADRIVVGDANGKELHARFSGGFGNDVLVGGIHRDVLMGGAGDDTLEGKARHDVCDGGSGADTFLNC